MKLSYAIDGIFPTPVYRSVLHRDFTKTELKLSKQFQNDLEPNTGNLITLDKYILDKPQFKKLKSDLMAHVKKYSEVILGLKESELYITQSWINYTKENQYHHIHAHPNSFISGVIYFDADENNDAIKFFKEGYLRIRPVAKGYHLFNATDWFYSVKSKQIILFPSELTHKVETKKGSNLRTSLAFNTFIKGRLGETNYVNELYLDECKK